MSHVCVPQKSLLCHMPGVPHTTSILCSVPSSLSPLTQSLLHTTGIRCTTECATPRLRGSSGHMAESSKVRPATNEDSEGIETVTSLLPNLTASVCEGRTRHVADTRRRSWKATPWTFAWEDQIRSRNLSSTYLLIPTPNHAVPDQKPTWSPRPRSRLQPALTWRLEPAVAGSDFETRTQILRDTIWTHARTVRACECNWAMLQLESDSA